MYFRRSRSASSAAAAVCSEFAIRLVGFEGESAAPDQVPSARVELAGIETDSGSGHHLQRP